MTRLIWRSPVKVLSLTRVTNFLDLCVIENSVATENLVTLGSLLNSVLKSSIVKTLLPTDSK